MTLVSKVLASAAVIAEGFALHNPRAAAVLFSGGDDSLVATHLAMQVLPRDRSFVAHIDTGIGVPETQQFVIETCEREGWPLKIYRAMDNEKADGTPNPQDYEAIVREHGFPGPGAHLYMYTRLKLRQVERLVREHKEHLSDRIMLVSGVRTDESARRKKNVARLKREGAQLWAACIAHFTKEDLAEYRRMFDLKRNPVKEKLCMSGECLCGAFAHKGELDEIAFWYPEVGARIRRLEEEVRAAGHSKGWEGGDFAVEHEPDAFMPLCVGCEVKFDIGFPEWFREMLA